MCRCVQDKTTCNGNINKCENKLGRQSFEQDKKEETFGVDIDSLILTNIRIWHKDTLVRTGANIPREEKATLFLQARALNSKRAKIRDKIDNKLGQKNFSQKVGYYNG
jgi:hypothetical protein